MEDIKKILIGISIGLFFSSLYLGSSYLAIHLSLYWNLCKPSLAWAIIGFIAYSCLYESKVGLKETTVGMISIIGISIYYTIAGTQPQLWVYFVVNSIVCINVITTSIRKTSKQ